MSITLKFKSLLHNDSFKVIKISGSHGDVIEAHKVDLNSILLVKLGNVTYKDEQKEVDLSVDDVHPIEQFVVHTVHFKQTSELVLITPSQSKIKFIRDED